MTHDGDVIVCGAGVGGLAVAAALARYKLRVLVLDKHPRQLDVYKGELLQPRSLEILSSLGALSQLRESGAVPAHLLECRTANGGFLGALDYRALGGTFDYVLLHYHRDIRAALMNVARNEGVDVRFGARVERIVRDPDGRVAGVAIGDEELRAALIVAADGRTSVMRRNAGLGADFEQYAHHLLAYQLEDAPVLGPAVTAFLTRHGLRALYQMPGGRARLYVQIQPGEYSEIRRMGFSAWLDELLASTTGLDRIGVALHAATTRPQLMGAWHGQASGLAVPGLALVGDAAHCVHPMAGQGMNAAIADSWLLAENVGQTRRARGGLLDPTCVDAAVYEYERQRTVQLMHIVRLSHRLASFFTSTSPLTRAIGHRMLVSNRHNDRLRYVVTHNMAGLGYRRFTRRDRLHQFGLLRSSRAGEGTVPMPRPPNERGGSDMCAAASTSRITSEK